MVSLWFWLCAGLALASGNLAPGLNPKHFAPGFVLRSSSPFEAGGLCFVAVGMDQSGSPKAIKTSDGGSTWRRLTALERAASGHYLTGVCCVSRDVWYAVGWKAFPPNRMRGAVFKTVDGGSSWAINIPCFPDSVPFYDVRFDHGVLGWINAGEGWVYRTTNGGASWFRVWVPPSEEAGK